jgi:hypothetical protein
MIVASKVGGYTALPSPDMSAADVVAFYQNNLTGIREGAILLLIASAFYLMFSVAITAEVKRIEGGFAPLAWSQLVTGIFTVRPYFVSAILWATAAFRLDRDPQITQALNDAAWLFYAMPGAPAGFQLLLIGVAILWDKNPVLIFPRWVGYLNILVGITYFFAFAAPFAKTGPFAWNGSFTYGIPGFTFMAWMLVMFFMLLRNNRTRVE